MSRPSFFKLIEVARCTNESMCRTSRSNSTVRYSPAPIIRPAPRKRPTVETLDKGKGFRPSSSMKPAYGKVEPRAVPCLATISCGEKKATAFKAFGEGPNHSSTRSEFSPFFRRPETCEVLPLLSEEGGYTRTMCHFRKIYDEKPRMEELF